MTFTAQFHANTLNAFSAGEVGSCRSRGVWFDASAFEGAFPAPLWVQRSGSQEARQMRGRLCGEIRVPGRSAQNRKHAVSAWRGAAQSCVERFEETREHVRCSEVTRHHVRDSEGARDLKSHPYGALQPEPKTRLTKRCSGRLRAVTPAASLRSGSLRASPAPPLSLGR